MLEQRERKNLSESLAKEFKVLLQRKGNEHHLLAFPGDRDTLKLWRD